MIKDRYRVFRMRCIIRRDRRRTGRCGNCNKVKTCAPWCWGPKLRIYLWIIIKNHNRNVTSFAMHSFKREMKWAGTESWHRY